MSSTLDVAAKQEHTTDSSKSDKVMASIVGEASFDQPLLPTQVKLVSTATLSGLGDRVEHRAILDSDIARPYSGENTTDKVLRRHISNPAIESVVHHDGIPSMVFVFRVAFVCLADQAEVLDSNIRDCVELVN